MGISLTYAKGRQRTNLYKQLALAIIEYLRTRFHTEAPHISVLSPEYALIRCIKPFARRTSILSEEEEGGEELSNDVLADVLDPTRIRGHATFGVRARFRNYTNSSLLKFSCSFYIRTAPSTEFRKVEIEVTVKGKFKLSGELRIYERENIIHISSIPERIYREPRPVIVAFGLNSVASEAADRIASLLYENADIVTVADRAVVEGLSTTQQTSYERIFKFLPPLSRRPRAIYATSATHYAVQNFLLEVDVKRISEEEAEAVFILRYIAPVLVKRRSGKAVRVGEYGFPTYIFLDERTDRWSIHHLIEVEGKLAWKNAKPAWNWLRTYQTRHFAGIYNLIPLGCLAIDEENGRRLKNEILLRDWHIHAEEIFPIKTCEKPLQESFEKAVKQALVDAEERGLKIDEEALRTAKEIVLNALRQAFPSIVELYDFQEKSLVEGLSSLILGKHKVIVLQARTAGGKTLAFLLPLLTYIVYLKLTGTDVLGTKALLFYPTTALQNDQAATIFKLLWHVNTELQKRKAHLVSLGILHGLVPRRYATSGRRRVELRLPCPICGQRLVIDWRKIQKSQNVWREIIVCSRTTCTINNPSSTERVLLETIKVTREAVYSMPPDILIVNPDILNARLTLAGREDPDALTMLGKRAYICERCGMPHDSKASPRKCRSCGYNKFRLMRPTYPRIIVVDEAHMLRGAFGAQVSHVLTRIEQAVRYLHNLPKDWRPLYFVSSATLNNPLRRAQELTASQKEDITVLSAERKKGAEPTNRFHVFLMPKLYSPEATVARIVEALYSDASALKSFYRKNYNFKLRQIKQALFLSRDPPVPATLVFVNRISEANDLLNYIESFAPPVRADGHTTDFKHYKVKVEDSFSRGELDAIVATKGLEVGVDFDRVDAGIIYGMPFYISDYTQRIGRIGRRQHSIIFNVFMPDKPIDYFYYKNWKLLCDGSLRDLHMQSEAYRIERENPEALKRAGQRAVLDIISISHGAQRILNSSITQRQREITGFLKDIKSKLQKHLQYALRVPPKHFKIALQAAYKLLDSIQQKLNTRLTLKRAIEEHKELLQQLHKLRSLEAEAEYNFVPIPDPEIGSRTRDMLYTFRHALPGQIISYRGNYFVIIEVSGRSLGTYPQTAFEEG